MGNFFQKELFLRSKGKMKYAPNLGLLRAGNSAVNWLPQIVFLSLNLALSGVPARSFSSKCVPLPPGRD
jgi:hypothetical protein